MWLSHEQKKIFKKFIRGEEQNLYFTHNNHTSNTYHILEAFLTSQLKKQSIFWSKSKLLRRNLRNFDSSSTIVDDGTVFIVCFATPDHNSVSVKTATGSEE